MGLLRHSARYVARAVLGRQAAPAAVAPEMGAKGETAAEMVARWLDVSGFLTRYHSRKAWILDQDPVHRAHAGMLTEFERKGLIVMQAACLIFYPFGLWYWWGQWTHMQHKPPGPLPIQSPVTDNRKVPFNWHNQGQCNECRWLELECRKMCYDRMREEGIEGEQLTLVRWGLQRVKTQSFGTY